MIVYTVLLILIKSCKVTKHSVSNQYTYSLLYQHIIELTCEECIVGTNYEFYYKFNVST